VDGRAKPFFATRLYSYVYFQELAESIRENDKLETINLESNIITQHGLGVRLYYTRFFFNKNIKIR